MNDKLSHRGPDGEGFYHNHYVSLSHKRLAIIDLNSRSDQPFVHKNNEYVIVFNGEIYNHLHIRSKLESEGYTSWKGHSDTETLLAAIEHWGVERGSGESLKSYYHRIGQSPLSKSKNLCTWELSPNGALHFNEQYVTNPDVYYFSFSTYSTKVKNSSTFHKPDSGMSVHLWPSGILMGQYNNAIDSSWYENDGVVNSVSMSHPLGSEMVFFNGIPVPGVWQSVKKLNMDHQAVIGHGISKKQHEDLIVLYNNHCQLLYLLK